MHRKCIYLLRYKLHLKSILFDLNFIKLIKKPAATHEVILHLLPEKPDLHMHIPPLTQSPFSPVVQNWQKGGESETMLINKESKKSYVSEVFPFNVSCITEAFVDVA